MQTTKDLVEYFILDNNRCFQRRTDHRVAIINAAIIFDTVWQLRNEVRHHSASVDLQHLIRLSKARVANHLMAWSKVESLNPNRWKPPDVGWLKVNTDVAVRAHGSFTAMSCRDSFSSLCFVYMERCNAVDPLLGEAQAVMIAMKQASQQGWSHVYFECDSLMLCNAILDVTATHLWIIEEPVAVI